MRLKTFTAPAFAALTILLGAAPASAAVMSATFTGVLYTGVDDTGAFSAAGTSLVGADFSVNFIYDTALGDLGPYYGGQKVFGGPGYDSFAQPLLSMSMTVFGETLKITQAGYGPFDHTEGYAFPDFADYSNDYAQGTFAFWGYVGHSTGPFMTANLYTDDAVPDDVSTPFTAHRVAGYSGLAQILLPGADHFIEGSTDMVVVTKLRDSAPVGGVPEPATWALMILGFGVAGTMLRRRAQSAGA